MGRFRSHSLRLCVCLCLPLSPPPLSPPQLTVGLYEFEVIVDGDGARGEGYVNVTVKPGELSRVSTQTPTLHPHTPP